MNLKARGGAAGPCHHLWAAATPLQRLQVLRRDPAFPLRERQPEESVVVIDDGPQRRKLSMPISPGVCMFHPGSVNIGGTWQVAHCAFSLNRSPPRLAEWPSNR